MDLAVKPGVTIPDEAKLQLTVRTYKPEVRKLLLDGIARIARGEAIAAGMPAPLGSFPTPRSVAVCCLACAAAICGSASRSVAAAIDRTSRVALTTDIPPFTVRTSWRRSSGSL